LPKVIAWQTAATVPQVVGGGGWGGEVVTGEQVPEVTWRGARVSDSTQRELPHCSPAGIEFSEVQAPLHPAGASNIVVCVPGASAQIDELAVKLVGKVHAPTGEVQEHVPHVDGGTWRSPYQV
jgi:hypothetical protein